MNNRERTKTTNPITNIILVLSVGLSVLEFSQLIFDSSNSSSLLNLDFNGVLNSLFYGLFLSADSLGSFWAIAFAWLISGAVAGVRAKSAFWGSFAGFFGSILGIAIIISINIGRVSNDESVLIPLALGSATCVLITTITAFMTGRATKPKKITKKTQKRTRKIWAQGKEKELWTCKKCGSDIPPGAFACPRCGEAVIE